MNRKSSNPGLKIIAGIEVILSGLLGYIFLQSRLYASPFFAVTVLCFGMAVSVLILRRRLLSIIFVSISGALTLITSAVFAAAVWVIDTMW